MHSLPTTMEQCLQNQGDISRTLFLKLNPVISKSMQLYIFQHYQNIILFKHCLVMIAIICRLAMPYIMEQSVKNQDEYYFAKPCGTVYVPRR